MTRVELLIFVVLAVIVPARAQDVVASAQNVPATNGAAARTGVSPACGSAEAKGFISCTRPDRGGPATDYAGRKHEWFYRNKWWWIERAVSAAAIIADAASTEAALRLCPTACGDSFGFFDPNTSGKVAGAGGISFALSTGLSILAYHATQANSDNKYAHLFGYVDPPATDWGVHGWAIVNNLQLAAKCREAKLTCR